MVSSVELKTSNNLCLQVQYLSKKSNTIPYFYDLSFVLYVFVSEITWKNGKHCRPGQTALFACCQKKRGTIF